MEYLHWLYAWSSDRSQTPRTWSLFADPGHVPGRLVLVVGITLTEFKTWLAVVKGGTLELQKLSFALLCPLLKVADALGDVCLEEWIRLAAGSLPPQPQWPDRKCSPEEASQGIDKLTHLLQRRVLGAAAATSSRLCKVLDFLPSKHHAAVLEATITETKSLEAPIQKSLHVAKALSSMPASPPPFLSLSVQDSDIMLSFPAAGPQGQEVFTHLHQALCRHTSLTSLRLKMLCLNSSSFKQLSPAIASLKCLRTLCLHVRTGPNSLPALQQTLAALPKLQHFDIIVASSEARKRQREDSAADAPRYCLSAMLSAATALTSLDIFTLAKNEYVTVTAPVSLPQLQSLAINFACNHISAAASLLRHLSAPLTRLDLHSSRCTHLHPSAVPDAHTLLRALATFTQLQSLSLTVPQDEFASAGPVLGFFAAATPATLAALPALASLHINTDLCVIRLAMPLLATGPAALTELDLGCHTWASAASWQAWPGFVQQLSRLKLQRLSITFCSSAVPGLPGVYTLPHLPHLTALLLKAGAPLTIQEDFAGLARQTQLKKLHLIDVHLPKVWREVCARCLGALSALTSLQVRSATEEGCISGVLEEAVPEGALPLLQELGLDIWRPLEDSQARARTAANRMQVPKDERTARHGDAEGGRVKGNVIDAIVSAGAFAKRLPELTQVDLMLLQEGTGKVPVGRLGVPLQDITLRGNQRIKVTSEGGLPF